MIAPRSTTSGGCAGWARALTVLAVAALALASAAGLPQSGGAPRAAPERVREEGYAGSESCRACHAENHASWHASYHRTMTQEPSEAAVLARWEGVTPALEGVAWRLTRAEGEFLAEPFGVDGRAVGARMRLALTTGSHHYQVYWLEAEGRSELGQLPLVWHVAESRWVPRHSLFLSPPPDTVFAEGGRWTRACIQCHTTNGTPHPGEGQRARVADFGISCEACHGPGAAHVAEQARRAELAPDARAALAPDRTIVNPDDLPHERASQVCGQCHGIHPLTKDTRPAWEQQGFAYRPGDDLAATRDLLRGTYAQNGESLRAFLDRGGAELAEFFWPDGQVRVSGREYNGLVDSPCFQRGTLGCTSCHDLHPPAGDPAALASWADDQLRPGMDGPRACLQCHAEYALPEALTAHTRHAPRSSGSDCLNCHMPYTTYGLVKAIRSHTITSPTAVESLVAGRPNACNLCHLDRTLLWTAEQLAEWHGQAVPDLGADQREIAAAVLWALAGDAGQRAIVAWALGWEPARAASGTGWMPPLVSTLAQDPYDAVRFVATRTARLDPRWTDFTLDFTRPVEEQRHAVRASLVRDWQRDGLSATPEQRRAVLIGEDGRVDAARFQALYGRVDRRVMRLSE
ncbi:MAG: C cytochrome precursor [Planctomycetes bacterium]|nr:C cytochrome precursor [Planctomycetota bacterium]